MECAENQNVKERLLEFIMFKNISIRSFEIQIGVSNAYLSNLKKQPREDVISKILNAYPELNKVWLLTGEGEMLRIRTDSRPEQDDDRNSLLATIASQQKTIERLTAMLDRLMMGDSEGKKEQKVV